MKVYINPGHDRDYDSGAVNPNTGLRECDVAYDIGNRVRNYLEDAGYDVRLMQSDNLLYDSDHADRPVAVVPPDWRTTSPCPALTSLRRCCSAG